MPLHPGAEIERFPVSTAESQAVPRRVPDVPHGTFRGWLMGCRCLFCGSAKTATMASTGVIR